MPRGKRTVYALFCTITGERLGTIRLHKQDKKAVAWKDHVKKLKKYCPTCRKKVGVKGKEERHAK